MASRERESIQESPLPHRYITERVTLKTVSELWDARNSNIFPIFLHAGEICFPFYTSETSKNSCKYLTELQKS